MDPLTFDRITRLFAIRRLSRRQAVTQATGLAATALAASRRRATADAAPGDASVEGFAVLATPAPGATAIATPPPSGAKPLTFLFLQSFARGSLVPKPGVPGHYLLTLEQGLGDTVYFSDRPAKIVGTVPTQHFLDALGFTPANPPNAALVGQRDATHKDIVVVELFDPHYDAAANTLTYEATLLADWHKLDETFQQTPDDEAQLPRQFTAAHLFIDDCAGHDIACLRDRRSVGLLPNRDMCWNWQSRRCEVCRDYSGDCNATFPDACHGACVMILCEGILCNPG